MPRRGKKKKDKKKKNSIHQRRIQLEDRHPGLPGWRGSTIYRNRKLKKRGRLSLEGTNEPTRFDSNEWLADACKVSQPRRLCRIAIANAPFAARKFIRACAPARVTREPRTINWKPFDRRMILSASDTFVSNEYFSHRWLSIESFVLGTIILIEREFKDSRTIREWKSIWREPNLFLCVKLIAR